MRAAILFLVLTLSLQAMAGEINQAAALEMLKRPGTVLIDVRTVEEFADGALPGAVRIETPDLAEQIHQLVPDKDTPVVLYCRSGRRSSAAQDVLGKLGYSQVINAGAYDDLVTTLPRD
ncbi:rhodanese-like domain-containing protein [Pseudomonas stutzeri]|uniref:Sulfurtransferase n=1 Tax=Stutzerimonas stutzeri TaxID=316 RepID=A0A2N8S367_STUST|nr:rhodanese-like domain-containing protein [Stutzerimonas stutzeri]MCQ4296647.1 rhodanese-like domain-containing protein [Stutzerimonas stutzeri]PNF81069.1 sulfurtransferase [Stutzerimonas stutzeri]